MVTGKDTEEEEQLGKVESMLSLRGDCLLVVPEGEPDSEV